MGEQICEGDATSTIGMPDRMNPTELAHEPLSHRVKRRIKRLMGPAGIFLQGFIEHPVMVGSIIPSSRFTIAKMLAPVKWDECKLNMALA